MGGFKSLTDWLGESLEKKEKPPKYGCVMMDAKIPDWEDYHTAGIEESDVFIKPFDKSYGLEDQPHVTVLYGIHEDEIDPEIIAEVIRQNLKPITLRVDEIDIFEGDEYDVVKYNLPKTKELLEYRKLFMKFPNTQTFPEYNPHLTIAYVHQGRGKKYKRILRDPFEVTFTKGVYSYHDNPDDPDEFSRKVINLENEI